MAARTALPRSLLTVTLVACAACSAAPVSQGASSPPAPQASPIREQSARTGLVTGVPQPAHRSGGWLSPAAKSAKGLIYVSDFIGNVVQIYAQSGSNSAPIGQITDGISGPEGSYVDKQGNLYVSNVTNYTVTKYPKGSTSWSLRYTGLAYPTDATVGKNGMVYIADLVDQKVVAFPKGSTRSKRTIEVDHPQGVALDRNGDLYVSYNTSVGQVDEYAPGSTSGTNLGITLTFAGGDSVDSAGNLVVADQSAPAVDIFAPGATQPTRTITQSLEDPFRIALDKQSKKLYVADPEANALFVYDYATGTLVNTITNGLQSVYGVAITSEGG